MQCKYLSGSSGVPRQEDPLNKCSMFDKLFYFMGITMNFWSVLHVTARPWGITWGYVSDTISLVWEPLLTWIPDGYNNWVYLAKDRPFFNINHLALKHKLLLVSVLACCTWLRHSFCLQDVVLCMTSHWNQQPNCLENFVSILLTWEEALTALF